MTALNLLVKLPHGVLRDAEVILILTSICIIFGVAMPAGAPSIASRVRGATFRLIYIIVGELFGVCVHLLTSAINIHSLLSVGLGDIAHATNSVTLVTTYILALAGSVWLGEHKGGCDESGDYAAVLPAVSGVFPAHGEG